MDKFAQVNGIQIHYLDHPGDGPPLIFETMVFQAEGFDEQDMERYSTLEDAIAGHKRMVKKWT